MRRKTLSLIVIAILAVSLTACTQKENEIQGDNEVVGEETTELMKDTTNAEESTEVAEDSVVEEVATEVPEEAGESGREIIVHEDVELDDGSIVDLVSYNENCPIANGIKSALGSNLYPGITIEYLEDGNWYLYYEGEPQAENSLKLGFDESILPEETVNKVVDYLSGNVQTFTDMNNGIVPAIDLNEDGGLSSTEVYIIDLLRTTDNLSFTGLFQIEGSETSIADRFTKEVPIIPISEYLSENNTNESTEATTSAESAYSHTYNWGIMEFDGEYSMEISIITDGIPSVEGSTIDFCVKESIFDYKLFSEIKCEGNTIFNKDIKPEWVDSSSGGDGIIGFVNDGFKLTSDGTSIDDEGRLHISFCFTGNVDGTYHEYSVVWEKDGSVTVSIGDLIEQ